MDDIFLIICTNVDLVFTLIAVSSDTGSAIYNNKDNVTTARLLLGPRGLATSHHPNVLKDYGYILT